MSLRNEKTYAAAATSADTSATNSHSLPTENVLHLADPRIPPPGPSHLLALPAELRTEILSYVLPANSELSTNPHKARSQWHDQYLALQRTHPILLQDVRPLVYKNGNSFVMRIGPCYDRSRAFRFFDSGIFDVSNVKRIVFSRVETRYETYHRYDNDEQELERIEVEVVGGGREFEVWLCEHGEEGDERRMRLCDFEASLLRLSTKVREGGSGLTATDWCGVYDQAASLMEHKWYSGV